MKKKKIVLKTKLTLNKDVIADLNTAAVTGGATQTWVCTVCVQPITLMSLCNQCVTSGTCPPVVYPTGINGPC